jgi:hypothetical protein
LGLDDGRFKLEKLVVALKADDHGAWLIVSRQDELLDLAPLKPCQLARERTGGEFCRKDLVETDAELHLGLLGRICCPNLAPAPVD